MKYKWKVQPEPTGSWRSFERRGWPRAEYPDETTLAYIRCDDDYYPPNVKTGNHAPLIVVFHDYSKPDGNCPWTRRRLIAEFATLQEAKDAFARLIEKRPEILPKSS